MLFLQNEHLQSFKSIQNIALEEHISQQSLPDSHCHALENHATKGMSLNHFTDLFASTTIKSKFLLVQLLTRLIIIGHTSYSEDV